MKNHLNEGEYHWAGEEAETFVLRPLFLCTLDGWKLLDRMGVGCCGWHFVGHGWVRGETLNHMLACAVLKLEISFFLSVTVRLTLFFTVQKKIPPQTVLPLCPTLVLSSGIHDVGCKQHKQTIRKVLVEERMAEGWDLTQYLSAPFPLSEILSISFRISGQLVLVEVPVGTASNSSVLFHSLTRQKMGTSSTRWVFWGCRRRSSSQRVILQWVTSPKTAYM